MSALLMGRAFYTDLPSHLRFLLVALCDHANDDGTGVFIGQERLARKLGTSARSVRTNLGLLREQGYIEREGKSSFGTDRYRIAVEKIPHTEPEDVSGQAPVRVRRSRTVDRKPTSAGDRKPTSAKPSVQPSEREELRSSLATNGHRDFVWEALDHCFGKITNDGERGRRSHAVKLLRQSKAQPEDITGAYDAAQRDPSEYVQRMASTDTALANNWSRLLVAMEHPPRRTQEGQGAELMRRAADMKARGE